MSVLALVLVRTLIVGLLWLNRRWRRVGMIEVLVVTARVIRRCAIIIILRWRWWGVVIDRWRRVVGGTTRRWLLSGTSHPRRQNPAIEIVIAIRRLVLGRPGSAILGRPRHRIIVGLRRLRVIGATAWQWLLSGTNHSRRQKPAIGIVMAIWCLVLGRPGLVILGRHRHCAVVAFLRIGRVDVRHVRWLSLRHPRRGPIEMGIRIGVCLLAWKIILPGIFHVRGNVVLIPWNDRMKFTLPMVVWR